MSPSDILRFADLVSRMGIKAIFLSGGEPLIVKGLMEAVKRWATEGIAVHLFTSGWTLDRALTAEISPYFAAIHVSVDGATEEVHDRIRQREGSFERALGALGALNELAESEVTSGKRLQFGVDCTLIQSNYHQFEAISPTFSARFPKIGFINIGAAVPSGVASSPWFASNELLTEAQISELQNKTKADRLPKNGLIVSFSDQKYLQMHPDDVARGTANIDTMLIEPDGMVRAMAMYEGTVGNVFLEPATLLWQRAQERWHDPFVLQQLSGVTTRVEWAAAVRALDMHFAPATELPRIQKHFTVLA